MTVAAYFIRESGNRFRPTSHVGGAWEESEQHIAPSLGLLAHAIERDFSLRRQDDLRLTRLNLEILGTIPMEPVELELEVLRPGRTIELVQARLSHAGRMAVAAQAWLCAPYDTAASSGSAHEALPPRTALERWGLNTKWPGGFVKSVEIYRRTLARGRVQFWVRTPLQIIEGEEVSNQARFLSVLDVANGVAARLEPEEALYPNLDLSVHLFRQPRGEWSGLDSTVSIGPEGAGLTHSILHDEHGPVGSLSQILTVRPR